MKKISGNLFRKRPGGLDYREEKCYNQRIKKPARRKRKFDMDVQLKPIAEDNFLAAFNLKLNPDQEKYVSHPVRSLAQAYVYRDQCQPFGIYCGDEMVGYVMVIYDYDVPEYEIWHMMIDSSRQGRGLGRAARLRNLQGAFRCAGDIPPHVLLVDDVRTTGSTLRVCTSCLREGGARRVETLTACRVPGRDVRVAGLADQ